MSCEILAGTTTRDNVSVIVPDNTVLVRVDSLTHAELLKASTVIEKVCSENLNLLALDTDTRDMGCDVVPPGYSVHNMMMAGHGSLSIDNTWLKTESWHGIVYCTQKHKIRFRK
jgi:hypothetical protein